LLLQAALQARGEHARSGEAAMLDMAGLQSIFSQQLAWRAARLAQAEAQTGGQTATQTDTDTDTDTASSVVTDRSEQGAALEQLLNTSMQEALQFEALVAQQVQTAGAAQAGLAAALDHWLAVRERLWYRGGTLLYHLDAAPALGDTASPVVAAAGAVQIEAERALQAAQALSDRLRSLAEHRGERQRAELQLWATGLLLLLGLLALVVVEPTVQRVRRQLRLLRAQALSLKKLALVAERTRAMVLITDAKGRTVWVNQAFTDITGWPLAKALGQQPAALLRTSEASNDDDVAATATASATTQCSLRAALASGTGVRVDCRARARDGSELWLDCDLQPVHDDDGRLTGWVNVNHDTTVRRGLQEQLHASARTDALTRLPNRAAVMERLQRAIEHARRHPGYGFAVLFMDFDRFKQVNDTLGHTMGDELLRQIAVRLETTLRPGDAVARVDSDLQLAARLGCD
jgi:PAS domain S-box-containing protein